MRAFVVFSCYGIGAIGVALALFFLTEEVPTLAGVYFGAAVSVFALGYICDSLGAIREALSPVVTTASLGAGQSGSEDWLNGSYEKSEQEEPLGMRFENGMIVLETDSGDLIFSDMQAAHNYLKGKS